jgi:hypothetical protein
MSYDPVPGKWGQVKGHPVNAGRGIAIQRGGRHDVRHQQENRMAHFPAHVLDVD